MEDKTVYILDSYGLIFRCYFAFISRPLTNQKGENVSALFGFFRNLHFIFKHYNPQTLIAAMDSKTKTFRHQMYDQYKATRPKTPEDLHAQIPMISEVLKALKVPVLQCDGYEADDIIASVAKKCQESKRECRILSGDKDLMQLVDDTTLILKPEPGAQTWKLTNSQGVFAEWGVQPPQLLDLLSLYGDSADNIPGVRGIGVKTASKLLTDYENLEGIYEHIEDLKGAVKTKLEEGKENAFFSRKLVKLCDQVPCKEIDEALLSKTSFDYSAASKALFSYGLPSVAKNYQELSSSQKDLQGEGRIETDIQKTKEMPQDLSNEERKIIQNDTSAYRAITKLSQLKNFIDQALEKGLVAYDSETDSLDTMNANIIGFSLCFQKGRAVYVPVAKEAQDLFSNEDYISLKDCLIELQRLFSDPKIKIFMHNAKFDLKVLINNIKKTFQLSYEEAFSKILKDNFHDTMIFAWILNPEHTSKNGYSLEFLGEKELSLKGINFSDIVEKNQTFAALPLNKATAYAAEDADFTFQIGQKQVEKLKAEETLSELFNLEMKILPVLTKMELEGFHLESSILKKYNEELSEGINQVEKSIYAEVGHEFNIASPKQLQAVLFEERHLKPSKKTKTGYSTDTNVLEELAYLDSVPKMILEYREMAKLKSTYVETLPKLTDSEGRIHTDFVQTGTATGRLSCREPNLQNIPVRSEAGRKIRSAFTAPKGKVLISADYAQIELVVLAHLSQDENMCKSFNEGTDVHKATAALIYNVPMEEVTAQMRRTAKTINFGVIYGMSAFRLARDLGISRSQAASFIENYFTMYKSVDSFIKETIEGAEKNGYVETILKRRRPIISINSVNKIEKSAAERIAVNSPVQGSAADIVKKAMLDVTKALEDSHSPAKLLIQVHDELIFECPDNKDEIEKTITLIKDKMENAVKLKVPLRVSIEYGKNWGEFH